MRRRKDPNVWIERTSQIPGDPTASDWLRRCLLEALNRDPVDSANDANVLNEILTLRLASIRREPHAAPKGRAGLNEG
jgi:hypothetical protein